MKTIKPFKIYQIALVCLIPFAVILAAFIFSKAFGYNFKLYGCYLYELSGFYCPGCGMTRAAVALLNGDILLSLKNNAFVLIGVLLLAMLYVELLFKAFGRTIKTPVRNKYFLIFILIIWAVYSVLRNFIPLLAPTSP